MLGRPHAAGVFAAGVAADEWLTFGEWRRRCKAVETRGFEAFDEPTTWKELE